MANRNKNESSNQEYPLQTLSDLEYIILEYYSEKREEHRTEDLVSLKRICGK